VEMESKGLADVLLDTPLFGCHTTGAEGYMSVSACTSALCRTPAHTRSLAVSMRHVFRVKGLGLVQTTRHDARL